ncbi:uncharacterized protein [Chelonus insularis]|uniref:uncharacterized protein n=1 Tax=Chelonus insularis TaxID=460826 RepID=UPI00158AB87D|nr:uncharacterized protein LOC118070571 [Chelonus insularis]
MDIEILSGAENLETEDATLKKQDVPKLNEKEALVLLNEELNLSNKDVQESYSLTKENTRETNFDKQLTSIKAASLKKIPKKRISRHSSFSNSEEREISQNECSYSDQSIDSTIVPPLNKKRKMNLKVSSDSESIEENSQRTGPKSFDSVHSGHNAKRKWTSKRKTTFSPTSNHSDLQQQRLKPNIPRTEDKIQEDLLNSPGQSPFNHTNSNHLDKYHKYKPLKMSNTIIADRKLFNQFDK